MTIFKPVDFNSIKVETNEGDVVTMQPVQNGFVGKIMDNYVDTTVTPNVTYKKAFVPLTAPDLATDNIYVVIDTPLAQDRVETRTGNLYEIKNEKQKGDYVRLFNAVRHNRLLVEFTANLVNGDPTTVVKGDNLIPAVDGSMKWVEGATASKATINILDKGNLDAGIQYFGNETYGSFKGRIVNK